MFSGKQPVELMQRSRSRGGGTSNSNWGSYGRDGSQSTGGYSTGSGGWSGAQSYGGISGSQGGSRSQGSRGGDEGSAGWSGNQGSGSWSGNNSSGGWYSSQRRGGNQNTGGWSTSGGSEDYGSRSRDRGFRNSGGRGSYDTTGGGSDYQDSGSWPSKDSGYVYDYGRRREHNSYANSQKRTGYTAASRNEGNSYSSSGFHGVGKFMDSARPPRSHSNNQDQYVDRQSRHDDYSDQRYDMRDYDDQYPKRNQYSGNQRDRSSNRFQRESSDFGTDDKDPFEGLRRRDRSTGGYQETESDPFQDLRRRGNRGPSTDVRRARNSYDNEDDAQLAVSIIQKVLEARESTAVSRRQEEPIYGSRGAYNYRRPYDTTDDYDETPISSNQYLPVKRASSFGGPRIGNKMARSGLMDEYRDEQPHFTIQQQPNVSQVRSQSKKKKLPVKKVPVQSRLGFPLNGTTSPGRGKGKVSILNRLGKKENTFSVAGSSQPPKRMNKYDKKRLKHEECPVEALHCKICNIFKFPNMHQYLKHRGSEYHVNVTKSFGKKISALEKSIRNQIKIDFYLRYGHDPVEVGRGKCGKCSITYEELKENNFEDHKLIPLCSSLHKFTRPLTCCPKRSYKERLPFEIHRTSVEHLKIEYKRRLSSESKLVELSKLNDLKMMHEEGRLDEYPQEDLDHLADHANPGIGFQGTVIKEFGKDPIPDKVNDLMVILDKNHVQRALGYHITGYRTKFNFPFYEPSIPRDDTFVIQTSVQCTACHCSMGTTKENILRHCSTRFHYDNLKSKREAILAKLLKEEEGESNEEEEESNEESTEPNEELAKPMISRLKDAPIGTILPGQKVISLKKIVSSDGNSNTSNIDAPKDTSNMDAPKGTSNIDAPKDTVEAAQDTEPDMDEAMEEAEEPMDQDDSVNQLYEEQEEHLAGGEVNHEETGQVGDEEAEYDEDGDEDQFGDEYDEADDGPVEGEYEVENVGDEHVQQSVDGGYVEHVVGDEDEENAFGDDDGENYVANAVRDDDSDDDVQLIE